MTPKESGHLEPRVAALETGIASLTGDIAELVKAVHEQGVSIGKLAVEVRGVQGPRKTDWGVILTAAGLMMAIGAAALSPLYLRMNDVQATAAQNRADYHAHTLLTLHPVGAEKIAALERRLDLVTAEGSPITQNRLVLLEEKVRKLEAKQ